MIKRVKKSSLRHFLVSCRVTTNTSKNTNERTHILGGTRFCVSRHSTTEFGDQNAGQFQFFTCHIKNRDRCWTLTDINDCERRRRMGTNPRGNEYGGLSGELPQLQNAHHFLYFAKSSAKAKADPDESEAPGEPLGLGQMVVGGRKPWGHSVCVCVCLVMEPRGPLALERQTSNLQESPLFRREAHCHPMAVGLPVSLWVVGIDTLS